MQWSSYLGGTSVDECNSACYDTHNNIYLVGNTHSLVPTTNCVPPSGAILGMFPLCNSSGYYFEPSSGTFPYNQGFITAFNGNREMFWSTYIGGNRNEYLTSDIVIKDNNSNTERLLIFGRSTSLDHGPEYPNVNSPGYYFQNGHNASGQDWVLSMFDLDFVTALDEIESQQNILIYPNPGASKIEVLITSNNLMSVRINQLQIMDMNGRIVKTSYFPNYLSGRHKYEVDIGELSSGIYILNLLLSDGVIARKLIKQ